MELEVLKKRISSYRGEGGRVKITDDGLLLEILTAWEQWVGPTSGFYSAIGVSQKGMASIIGRAKKLRREGFPVDSFKELKVVDVGGPVSSSGIGVCGGIELCWKDNQIKFSQVDLLLEFLKKVA